MRKAICNFESDYWKLKKGYIIEIIKEYFYNGEYHLKGKMNGKVVNYPSIFFDEIKKLKSQS